MMKNYLMYGIILGFIVGWGIPSSEAYEVWVADQSDTAKGSGGFLYVLILPRPNPPSR